MFCGACMKRTISEGFRFSGVVTSGSRHVASMNVFNRNVKALQRGRSVMDSNYESFQHLRNVVGGLLIDRVRDVKASHAKFERALDIGSRFQKDSLLDLKEAGGVRQLHQMDISQRLLDYLDENDDGSSGVSVHRTFADEEDNPFCRESGKGELDLVISNLALHWTNDLPTSLQQIRDSLRPDGMFVASIFGGSTLQELRDSFLVAEQERFGGVSIRVSPMAGVTDAGNLLTRSRFALTTVDMETVVVNYQDMFQLMEDLRGMGESSAALHRGPPLARSTLFAAAAAYQGLYGNEDGTIPATFQIIFMTGWHPAESQPKPLTRGSAQYSFKDMKSLDSEVEEDGFSLADLGEVHALPEENELDGEDEKKGKERQDELDDNNDKK